MATITTDYLAQAEQDAKDTARHFADVIAETLLQGDEIESDLFNDYPNGDGYHHENHVDKEYDLQEAADVLDQCSDFEETDSGLWEGCDPHKAISAQAAYTYGNAVMAAWDDTVQSLNDDDDLTAMREMATLIDGLDTVSIRDTLRTALETAIESRLLSLL